jgi:hypothetical protein
MGFLAAQTFSRAGAGQRLVRFPMIERPPVFVDLSHLSLEHFAD